MLGAHQRPEVRGDRLIPIEAWGLKAMSMGLLVEEDSAMIWRGPMIMGAVQQFLGQVEWGELDVLVVDLPPGTGDIQLTLSQRVQVTGAVIVSTPQDIALIDARRAVRMFEKVRDPGPRRDREYECLLLPELRASGRNLRPWRGPRGGGAAGPALSRRNPACFWMYARCRMQGRPLSPPRPKAKARKASFELPKVWPNGLKRPRSGAHKCRQCFYC